MNSSIADSECCYRKKHPTISTNAGTLFIFPNQHYKLSNINHHLSVASYWYNNKNTGANCFFSG